MKEEDRNAEKYNIPARMNPFASPTCILAGTGKKNNHTNRKWFGRIIPWRS